MLSTIPFERTNTHSGGATQQEGRTLQWDASGHLTSDGQLHFEYDPRGRINKIVNSTNGNATSYQTNALGQRVRSRPCKIHPAAMIRV